TAPLKRRPTAMQLINAEADLASALFQSVLSIGGSSPVAFARTDHSGRPIPRCHPLTLIVFPASSLARTLRIDGLYILARLSSFQRTDEVRQGRPTDVRSGLRPSHRSGLAGKASPHVECGAFRGTFRGYRHHLALSTEICDRHQKSRRG